MPTITAIREAYPVPFGGHQLLQQTESELIFETRASAIDLEAKRFRVRCRLDNSHSSQSSATLEVWMKGRGWSLVAGSTEGELPRMNRAADHQSVHKRMIDLALKGGWE